MRAIRPMARCPLRPLLRGVLLGAALTAGATASARPQRAAASTAIPAPLGQTAMILPRPASSGGVAGLPQVLAPSEAARLRRIFEAQARGDLAGAEREAERLEDRRLLGQVLAD